MCQAPPLDQGSYPLEVVIDGMFLRQWGQVPRRLLHVADVSKQTTNLCERWLAPPLHDARNSTPARPGAYAWAGLTAP